MAALDPRRVEEAGVVADQQAAGEGELRQRLHPAGADGARAVGEALAALQEGAERRMGLVTLELAERIQVGILVVEADGEPDGNRVVLQVVHPRAAIGSGIQRPAGGGFDEALLVLRRVARTKIPQVEY